ncbi:long-chain fatty acid--CoA ligase [Streptomyces sp. Root369]|uniref:long-chain-fatty-acid--CoA ligase n=1 Tax=Streptomyces sp. Root369 TaxID=1736523 RepID=UPI00070C846A|nr:long-chain fatty acid--CoA ligase [Streptomyces sp. Root369]KQW03876.1 long-chain fatty acid--CoA ligase [Streptomyces sp. Root369]
MTSSTRNVSGLLTRTASGYPARTAIVFGGDRISYAELDAASNRVANLLIERGVRPGEKVAVSCTNIPQFTTVYFGILKAGAVVVPLNVLLKAREIAYHLNDSDATVYFAVEGSPELPIGREAWSAFQAADRAAHFFLIGSGASVDGVAPDQLYAAAVAGQPETYETVGRADDDTAVILYTSGTTGQPKGAELRHRNVYDIARAGVQLFASDPATPDVYLCVLPLFHAFGQMVIQNGAIGFGGTLVLQPRFSAREALELMRDHDVTFFGGVPTMYWGLLEALDDSVDVDRLAANLRIAVSGGSALPAKIHQEFRKRFGVTILEGYGLSESVAIASFATYGEEPRVGSIGRPIAGVEMKLINDDWSDVEDDAGAVGEIAIKGYNIMKGYYKRPEATSEAIRQEWFRTGDLARKDADGFYFVVDRSKDMIIRGGFNVYPRELEEVLMEHPAVSLVAVIGVPHLSHGEEIKAVVVKKAGDSTTEAELTAWGKEQFAGYKYPRIVEFVDALPMTATGKILKRELS